MRKVFVIGLALAVVPVGMAFAGSGGLKVTGGGQVLTPGQAGGPGDTIAFNAQQDGALDTATATAPAKGQLQVQKRPASGGGKAELKFHGNVTCIRTFVDDRGTAAPEDDEAYVRFGGVQKVKGKSGTTPFTVDVQDNGQGASATESDVIFFRTRGATEDPCDDSDLATQLRDPQLARGNVKQH